MTKWIGIEQREQPILSSLNVIKNVRENEDERFCEEVRLEDESQKERTVSIKPYMING